MKALRLWRAAWERSGVQIVTMAQLAARLACGFTHPARSQDLDPAIRAALETRDFAEFRTCPRACRCLPASPLNQKDSSVINLRRMPAFGAFRPERFPQQC
ncbi:MAG: hypothetical protein E5W82_32530 [Mesorhizobium sp.]|nr:MAG: hypothetical protein E5W82_32530 [Mesorhizobium sp.]